jgi:hypothetical protein
MSSLSHSWGLKSKQYLIRFKSSDGEKEAKNSLAVQ